MTTAVEHVLQFGSLILMLILVGIVMAIVNLAVESKKK